jgi:hypothetical protein
LIAKKTYFIPKYFVQGYNGNFIWLSLIKEDVKERFERERPPSDMSEFETPDYVERKQSIKTLYQGMLKYRGPLHPQRRSPYYGRTSKEKR